MAKSPEGETIRAFKIGFFFMKGTKAHLSIIITNYNKPPEQVNECVESVLNQTIPAKEVFLIDDHSNKAISHDRIISVILPENLGPSKARNFGASISTGKLLLFVDADDKLPWDFVEKCGEKLPEADIVYPNLIIFGETTKHPYLKKLPNQVSEKYILSKASCVPVTSMMKRSIYERVGGFREFPIYEDWDFYIRAFRAGAIFKKANTHLMYRQAHNNRMNQPLSLIHI